MAVVVLLVCSISFVTRLGLLVFSWKNIDFNLLHIVGIFLLGLFYDIVVAAFFCIPVALYCLLMKDGWYQQKFQRIPLFILFSIITFILIFNACGEFAFWDEFSVRYNFIAVDYLIYTTEVLENIWQSYNIPLIATGILIFTMLLVFIFRKKITLSQTVSMRFTKRGRFFLFFLIYPAAAYFLVNNHFKNISSNNYVNELAGNGIYEFGHAYWHNEIDYTKFYATQNDTANFLLLKKLFAENSLAFSDSLFSIERTIKPDSPEHKWNIVLISVESLSGDYMQYFGNKDNITPYLDSLISHSLFFKNFYATGTRTVRGLEALSLSIPPTPGQSIVRRPNNENMLTIGNVLKDKGYDVNYIYGGNSFFDNMGYFFSHNGYTVLDKRDIPDSMVHHTTAWGVDDEAAFNYTLQQCDKSYKEGRLFFNHIMTVSNHRPYTYPDGRIDIPPSTQSINGGVKYTDYAINKFLQDARKKEWFDSTLFIIVADHCAKSAGKTDLPVNRYHIPCFIYAPTLIKPKIEDAFTSQIDLIPTILGFMNLNYTSRFMGYDIYKIPKEKRRLFISTYQDLGYIKNNELIILSPKQKVQQFKVDFISGASQKILVIDSLRKEAIAWYQGASWLFKNKGYLYLKK